MTQMPAPVIPRAEEVRQFLYKNATMAETRRFRQIDRYEAHYRCTQYSHQSFDWWGKNADSMETISPDVVLPSGYNQPMLELSVRQKRPTAPYNLAKAAVDRFTGLLFSETRRPEVVVENDPDTTAFLDAVREQCRFWAKMREARTVGGSTGSVLVTAHLRGGKFCLEVHNPKHCQFMWRDRRTFSPRGVLKCYRFPVEEEVFDERTGESKGTTLVDYLYRRIITEDDDTVYTPIRLDGKTEIAWEVESHVVHNLGFFPGVWIQNLPVLESEDGEPDCQGAWQTLDTMDRILSQMTKGVLLNLDPTLVLKVDARHMAASGGDVRKGSENALHVGVDGDAKYLEMVGAGVTVAKEVVGTLKQNALDVIRCVLVDPEKLSGAAQSAKAIEYIYAPMLEKADDLRAQYGDLGVVPLMHVIERIARAYEGKTMQLADGRTGQYAFNLPPKIIEEVGANGAKKKLIEAHKLGPGGYIQLQWGAYFAPTEQDKAQSIKNVNDAKLGGLIDQETAVRQTAPVFGVRDPETVLERVRGEAAAEVDRLMNDGYGDSLTTPVEEEKQPSAGDGGKP